MAASRRCCGFRLWYTAFAPLVLSCAVHAQDSAKELFIGVDGTPVQLHGTPAKPGKPRVLGLQTTIYQVFENGGMKAVSPSTVFTGGDRIRLGFNSNRPGFLYVVNIGSSGTIHTLFPSSPADNNEVQPGFMYQIPQQAGKSIRFDIVPGEERILVVLAESRISQFDYGGQTVVLGPQTAPGMAAPPQMRTERIMIAAMESVSSSKDLFVQDEGPIRTMVLSPTSDAAVKKKPLVATIRLTHR